MSFANSFVSPGGAAAALPIGMLVLLRDLIHERLGTFFDESRLEVMAEKLEEPAKSRQCRSLLDYYYLLKYDADNQTEWEKVMDSLSVQETYFWREMSQIEAVVKILVPQWFKTRYTPLRIWSAACASGEEPITLAIALQEAGWGNHPIKIIGSDASSAAIAKAKSGIYRERSFRALPVELREKYFAAEPQGARIRPEIHSRIHFSKANLLAPDEIQEFASCPIVFCRNVFIYFSPEGIRRAVTRFSAAMPDHSHLFVGASESLVKLTSDYQLEELGDSFVYIRNPRERNGS